MAALTRTIYSAPGRRPSDLVALAQHSDQAIIERHLLDGFIPAVYAAGPPPPGTPPQRTERYWPPEQAERWLRLLARHLHRHNTRELAWWELEQLVPRLIIGLAGGLPVGLAGLLAYRLMFGFISSLTLGLAGGLGLAFGLAFGLASPSPPSARVDVKIHGRLSL